jgi:integrase
VASIQKKSESWYCQFVYRKQRYTFIVGKVDEIEARAVKGKVEYLLMRLKQNLLTLPPGCDILTFVIHDGKPPGIPSLPQKELTLSELHGAYVRSQQGHDGQEGKFVQTTLDAISLHFSHLTRILGGKCHIPSLSRADLQRYVDTRAAEWIDPEMYRRKSREKQPVVKPTRRKCVRKKPIPRAAEPPDRPKRHPSPATIKKEIISLRTAWNWARRHLHLQEEFPGGRLDHEKLQESLPFMSWEEALDKIAGGEDPEQVWDSVYLKPAEVSELLEYVKERPVSPWVYPMFVFAAYTGARRSEVVRAKPSDVLLGRGEVIIREMKRVRKKKTYRIAPLTPFLKRVLEEWLEERADSETLFCKKKRVASVRP